MTCSYFFSSFYEVRFLSFSGSVLIFRMGALIWE